MTNINANTNQRPPWQIIMGGSNPNPGILQGAMQEPAVVPPPRPYGESNPQFNRAPGALPLQGPEDFGVNGAVQSTQAYDAAAMSEDFVKDQMQEAWRADQGTPATKDDPGKEPNAFMKWWSSDKGKIQRLGFFDALSNIGAGLAGVGPGSNDYTSLSRGLAAAQGSYERAAERFHSRQFSDRINARIAAEEAKGDGADQKLLMTLYAAAKDPTAYVRGMAANGGYGPLERAQLSLQLAREKSYLKTPKQHQTLASALTWMKGLPKETLQELLPLNGAEGVHAWGDVMIKEGIFMPVVAEWISALAADGKLGPQMQDEDISGYLAQWAEENGVAGQPEVDAVVIEAKTTSQARAQAAQQRRNGVGETDEALLNYVTGE
jgi:hypothetical protein